MSGLAQPYAGSSGSLGMAGMGATASAASDTTSNVEATPTTVAASTQIPLLARLRAFALKNVWLLVFVAAVGVLLYTRQGRGAMCSNFGIACDTRPLPGGIRALD